MNEVMQIRAASWAAMIKQRNDSGLTIREWCAANDIVFTSEMPKGQRKPGDWGGLIICGKAKNNQGVLNQPRYFYSALLFLRFFLPSVYSS